MPFVQVRCTSCGGDIQLDDSKDGGFCVHCGTKVVFKEAVEKMELSGSVSVKGIADLEKLLQNAETFRKLGDFTKETEILSKITNDYPEDYRAWWRLAYQYIRAPYDRSKDIYKELDEYLLVYPESTIIPPIYSSLKYLRNAIKLAPSDKIVEMKKSAIEYYQSFFAFYNLEKAKIINCIEYEKKFVQLINNLNNKVEETIKNYAHLKAKEEMRKRHIQNASAGLVLVAAFIVCSIFLNKAINENLAWGVLIVIIIVVTIPILILVSAESTVLNTYDKRFQNYYNRSNHKYYYNQATKDPSYWFEHYQSFIHMYALNQTWIDDELEKVSISPGVYDKLLRQFYNKEFTDGLESFDQRIDELSQIINEL